MNAPVPDTVATPTAAYNAAEAERALPRALMGGTAEIRRRAERWLPPWEGEKTTPEGGGRSPYQMRVEMTTCYPFYSDAVKDAVSSILGHNVQLGEDVPAEIHEHCENIDLRGNNLTVFMRQVLDDSVGDAGVSYILIDHPAMPEGATYADLKASGKRPYWIHVRARDYLNPDDYEIVDGRPRPRCIRIKESITQRDGHWKVKAVERIRVFVNPPLDAENRPIGFVRWEVYEKTGKGEWETEPRPENTGTLYPMQEITLIPIYSGYEGFHCARPMFSQLAELNLSHLRKRSDLDHTLHKVLPPVIHRTGVREEDRDKPIVLEAARVFNSTAAPGDADMKYVEHSGKNIATAQNDLDRLEKRMEALALEPHVSRTSETATGRAIDFDTARTQIQALAIGTKDGIELALGIHAVMIGLDREQGGTVTLNALSRPMPQAAQETISALEWLEKKGYGPAELVAEGKRRGLFSPDLAEPPEGEPTGEFAEDLAEAGAAGAQGGRQILVLDFDGVLHLGGARGGITNIPGPPSKGAREFLTETVKTFRVAVFGGRSATPEGRQAMEAWCRRHFGREIAGKLSFPATKPAAFVSLDDRGMQFEGRWPTVEQLRTFRAWNERNRPIAI